MRAQPALRQPSVMPWTTAHADLRSEPSDGEVIEEEQGFGPLHDDVVDAHGHEVDADRVVAAGLDGDLDLRADAVIGGHQHRIAEPRRLEVEQTAETADLGVGAGAAGGAHERPDGLDHGVAGVDVDAGLRVSQTLRPLRRHRGFPRSWQRSKARPREAQGGPGIRQSALGVADSRAALGSRQSHVEMLLPTALNREAG